MKVIEVRDPSRQQEVVVPARCDGGHAFENICNDCNSAMPSGECSVCPHMPGDESGHFVRRPCRACGSSNLRSVRVKGPMNNV